jgi:hypothetical protein
VAWFKFRKAAFNYHRIQTFHYERNEISAKERANKRKIEIPVINTSQNEFPILAKHMRILLIDAYRISHNNID